VTSADAIRLTRQHVERQFPKVCGACGQRFESLIEYLRLTTHVGDVASLDAQMGDWRPKRPAGTLSLANCRCGTTLAVGSDGMGLFTLWRLLHWAKGETKRRGVTLECVLTSVREEIDREVLAEAAARASESRKE